MLGDDPLDRKINKAAVTRAWILRHPYYNYTHAPPEAEEYARRQSELQGLDLSYLLN
jgi:hypothetical protein